MTNEDLFDCVVTPATYDLGGSKVHGNPAIECQGDGRPVRVLRPDGSDDAPLYVLPPRTSATLRTPRGTGVMLCGSETLATTRHVRWNFLSSSRERIDEAKAD